MATELCAKPNSDTYRLPFDGEKAKLGAARPAPATRTRWRPMEHAPHGLYVFDSEFAHLRLDRDGQLLAFDELNDVLGVWLHFAPVDPR